MPNWVRNIITITCSNPATLEAYFNVVGRPGEHFDFEKIIPMPKELNIESGSRTDNGITCARWYAHPKCPATNDIIPKMTMEEYELMIQALGAGPYGRHQTGRIDLNQLALAVHRLRENHCKCWDDKKEQSDWDEILKLGQQACSNIIKYGAPTWYEWCIANWGTKWNLHAGDGNVIDENGNVTFDTAWSAPKPIIDEIVRHMTHTQGLHGTMCIEHKWADEDIGNNCGEQSFEIDFDDADPVGSTQWSYIDADEMSADEAYALAESVWGCQDDEDNEDDNEQGSDNNN